MRQKNDSDRQNQERKAHFMKCPKCGADLKEETHDHVKVDICPECKGLWLDSGELDIIRHMQKAEGGHNVFKGIMSLFPGKSSSRK